MEKPTLKRTAGPPNAPQMIEGSSGPIIYPFSKIDDEFLRVRRSQIAILVAHKSNVNVSIKARTSEVLPEGGKGSEDTTAAAKKSSAPPKKSTTGSSYPVPLMPISGQEYHPEVESVVKDAKSTDEVARPREAAKPEKEEEKYKEELEKDEPLPMPAKYRPIRLKRSMRQKKKPQEILEEIAESTFEDEGPDTVFEYSTGSSQDTNFDVSSTSDDTMVRPSLFNGDMSAVHIPKANVKHYFQWQFEKLAQQLEEDERCTQSDISECNIHHLSDFGSLSVGNEALKFHKMANKSGEKEYANRFLLLVGHCIPSLMKKPDFLKMDLDEVCKILSSKYFGVTKERNVLRAAYSWLQHEPAKRKRHTSKLMGTIRFGLLTKKEQVKCLAHNQELLSVLLNVPPFQRAFIKNCLWNYAQDAGLPSEFKEFKDEPRISYLQSFGASKRPGKVAYPSGTNSYFSSALLPNCYHTPANGFNASAGPVENRGAKDGKKAKSGVLTHVNASTAVVLEAKV